MKLIVGLGNPGRGYTSNRHNIGFLCLNHLARAHNIPWDKKQAKARTGTGQIAGQPVVLAKPQTYMNRSGESVQLLVAKFKIDLEDLLVVHDDLDLPLGKIRIRRGGRSAGHKGINSIIEHLETEDFIRIRVGIGRPETEEQAKEAGVIEHVLSDFTPEERKLVDQVIPRVTEAIVCLLAEGLTVAMNKFN